MYDQCMRICVTFGHNQKLVRRIYISILCGVLYKRGCGAATIPPHTHTYNFRKILRKSNYVGCILIFRKIFVFYDQLFPFLSNLVAIIVNFVAKSIRCIDFFLWISIIFDAASTFRSGFSA